MTDSTRRRRRTPKPEAMSAEETLTVTTAHGKDDDGKRTTEKLSVRKFLVEPAYVRVNAGMTKNMGNYESLRLDVSLTVPCYAEEIAEVFPEVADRVSAYLEEELANYE